MKALTTITESVCLLEANFTYINIYISREAAFAFSLPSIASGRVMDRTEISLGCQKESRVELREAKVRD